MTATRPLVIGLAGGIGSGKSSVAALLAEFGCIVLDSDQEAREALARPDVRDQLIHWWGPKVIAPDGGIDRSRIAAIVFSDPAERRRLESLVHPLVKSSREEMIRRAAAVGAPVVVVDAPLLFEAGVDQECDVVVFVDAPLRERLERVRVARGWGPGELERREKAQWGLDAKRRLADYVVLNDSGPAELRARVAAVFQQLSATRSRGRA